jgi:hypothetical protein
MDERPHPRAATTAEGPFVSNVVIEKAYGQINAGSSSRKGIVCEEKSTVNSRAFFGARRRINTRLKPNGRDAAERE